MRSGLPFLRLDRKERTDKGTVELVPSTLVPNDQLWFHHPEMQARIVRAEEDFGRGRSTRTSFPGPVEEEAVAAELTAERRRRAAEE